MLPQKLLIATSNQGKYREILEIFGQVPFEILSLIDVGLPADFKENAETFDENALGKARYYASKSGLMTLAEDSGILVDALQGELGVKTRRWGAGEHASDQVWIDYFLQRLQDVPAHKRSARFVCHAALVNPITQKEKVFCAETVGTITYSLEAPIYSGLPLSSCFKPDGFDKVYAALTIEEKNLVSHRGKAVRQACAFLIQKNRELH